MAPKERIVWLQKASGGARPICFIDAGHQGDMHHLRAAMQLSERDYSLVLYLADITLGCKKAETQDHLQRFVDPEKRNTFFCPWDYN